MKGWDYRQAGYYFVTFCTHDRAYLFNDKVFYQIACEALKRIPSQPHAVHIELDEWVVMPNHVHVVFVLKRVSAEILPPINKKILQNAPSGSLGVVVGRYKSAVTNRINALRKSRGDKVWQRGYYDHIIRSENEWRKIQRYIRDNPLRWQEDRDNWDNLIKNMTYHS